ncbi:MAG TPA: hypothetical protein PK397_06555 [Ignavibacteriaceae bacterium]|nr:hypothetical protein [Ignavibacteriaceae bacterium]
MKPLSIIFNSLVLIILFTGCENSVNNSNPFNTSSSLDTLERNITSGVRFTLNGLKDSYNFGDNLTGTITLTNYNDTAAFMVYFPIWPAWGLDVYDENMNFVGGGPESISFIDVRYELKKGESNVCDVYWSKTTYSKAKYGVSFPAFSGKYLLKFSLSGNNNFHDKYLTKWITVNENGKQDPVIFQNTYDQWDVAILDLALRNRFSKELTYSFKSEPKAELTIIDYPAGQDTVYQKDIWFSDTKFTIPGKKDTLLFSYHLDKRDSILIKLDGTYKILLKLSLVELDTTFSAFSQFAKGN